MRFGIGAFSNLHLLLPLLVLLAASPVGAEPLTPERAVALAATRNPGLRAALADVEAARHAVAAQRAARGPLLVASASGERTENMVATGQGVTRTEARGLGSDLTLRYTTEIGTTLEAGASGNLAWRSANITPNDTSTVSLGPNPSAALRVSARQPLLRGGGRDAVLAGLREALAGRTEAERSRDEAASALVRDVLVAYWELWYAQRAVTVQRAALEVARTQHRDARVRAEQLGTAPRTEVLRFASELAAISDSLAQARETQQARALELARLLALPATRAPAPNDTGEPPVDHALPPLQTLLEHARARCSQLRALAASLQGERERLRAAAAEDQTRLDLIASLSAAGLWADDDLPGLDLPGDRPAYSAMLALELELPVGASSLQAAHAAARARVEAARARYEARAQVIDGEVARLRARLALGSERIELSRAMTESAAALAAAERQRLQLGTATSIDVVQAQQADREAELRALRARVDQAQASLELDHLVGALLVRHAGIPARAAGAGKP